MERQVRKQGQAGNAVVEVALLLPWIVFLFMGVFDFGFYAYALISTENAARSATMYLAGSYSVAEGEWQAPAPASQPGACQYVLGELRKLPNVGASVTGCSATPVQVSVQQPALQADGSYMTRVSVTYRTVPLFPLPWMAGQMTITRNVEMRIFGD
jgi:hypothetical protein